MIKLTVFRLVSQALYFFGLERLARWLGYQSKKTRWIIALYIFIPDYLLGSALTSSRLSLTFCLARCVFTLFLLLFVFKALLKKVKSRERALALTAVSLLTLCNCLFLGKHSAYTTSQAPFAKLGYKLAPGFSDYKNITSIFGFEINEDSALTYENQNLFYGKWQASAEVPRRVLESLWISTTVGSYSFAWIDSIILGNILLLFMGLLAFWAFVRERSGLTLGWLCGFLFLLALNPRELGFISQTSGYLSGFFLTVLGSLLLALSLEAGLTILMLAALAYDTWYFIVFLAPVFAFLFLRHESRKRTFRYVLTACATIYFWHEVSLKFLPAGGNLGWLAKLSEKTYDFFLHHFEFSYFFERFYWIFLSTVYALGPYLLPFILALILFLTCADKKKILWMLAVFVVTLIPEILLAFGDGRWDGRIVALCPRYADSIYYDLALLLGAVAFRNGGENLRTLMAPLPPLLVASGSIFMLVYAGYLFGIGLYPWWYIWQIPGFGQY